MSLSRSTFYKESDMEVRRRREKSRTAVVKVIEEVVEEWPAYG